MKTRLISLLLGLCAFSVFLLGTAAGNFEWGIQFRHDQHRGLSTERISTLESQVVSVQDFKAEGLILDIGGGGKGIRTGYGIPFPETVKDPDQDILVAEECGFPLQTREENNSWFYPELKKNP